MSSESRKLNNFDHFDHFDNYLSGIIVSNDDQNVIYVNDSAQRILSFRKLTSRNKINADNNAVLARLQQGNELLTNVEFNNGREELEIVGNCCPLVLASGQVGSIYYLHDVSVEKRLHAKYNGQIEILEVTKNKLATIGLLFLYAVFGFEFMATKYALTLLPPFLLASIFCFITGVCLGIYSIFNPSLVKDKKSRSSKWTILLSSMLLLVIPNGLMYWALMAISSGIGAVLYATIPIWLALLEFSFRKTKTSIFHIGAIVAGIAGVFFVFVNPKELGNYSALPMVAFLFASISIALGVIISKDDRTLSYYAKEKMLAAGLLLVGSVIWDNWSDISSSNITPGAVAGFAFAGIIIGVFATPLQLWIMKVSSQVRGSSCLFVSPIIAVFVGTLLGEAINMRVIFGTIILLSSVVALNLKPKF
jgi:drug/metabolite transporter (DMT)-like permease